jgi:hypothetical protein
MNDFLQLFFVVDHEDYRHVFQFPSAQPQATAVPQGNAIGTKGSKVNIRWEGAVERPRAFTVVVRRKRDDSSI